MDLKFESAEQAAARLGIDCDWLRRLLKRGRIPGAARTFSRGRPYLVPVTFTLDQVKWKKRRVHEAGARRLVA